LFEGLFIGGISAIFEVKHPGIVIRAVGATFVTAHSVPMPLQI
jgi:hypothetical protein